MRSAPKLLPAASARRHQRWSAPQSGSAWRSTISASPGSITLLLSTLIAVLGDMVESLAGHGFESFYFINGHGGNIATVTAAFPEIYATRSLSPAVEGRRAGQVPAQKLVAGRGGLDG